MKVLKAAPLAAVALFGSVAACSYKETRYVVVPAPVESSVTVNAPAYTYDERNGLYYSYGSEQAYRRDPVTNAYVPYP